MSRRGSAILIGLFFAAMQLFVLPPEGFTTGDQGSKYLQTRAFAAGGPIKPNIDIAARDVDPDVRRQEPKLKLRRGRVVSEFMWLLPLLSAPFLRLLGMRGLYVVPALSAIAAFYAAAALGRRASDPRGLRTAWIVALATPICVYGLELWEHAPAAACVLAAAALLMPMERGRAAFDSARATGGLRYAQNAALAGALIATAALFREEAGVALPAILIARACTLDRDRVGDLIRTGVWAGVGAAAVFCVAVPIDIMMYGSPLPMHMTQDAWQVATTRPFWQMRREFVEYLLLPATQAYLFVPALLIGVAAALAATRTAPESPRRRGLLVVVHAAVTICLVIGVMLPLAGLAGGVRQADAYRVESAAHTWPFALLLLYWPWCGESSRAPLVRFLVIAAALIVLLTFPLVPGSGGGQWSPRFLLPAALLLGVASAEVAQSLKPAVACVLASSFLMQAIGVAYVAQSKMRFAGITHATEWRSRPGDVLISDIFWFPEVTSTLAPSRRYLFSWSASDVPDMVMMAVRAGHLRFSLVTSTPTTGFVPPPSLDIPGAPCRFVRGQQFGLDTLGLTLSRYACEGS